MADRIMTWLLIWVMGGSITMGIMAQTNGIGDTWLDIITVYLFWPLFVIKYLIIGVQLVVYNGLALLF